MYTLQSNARLPYTTQGSALDKMLCKVVMTCLWPCTARLQVHHGRCLSSGDTKFSGDSHLEVCCTYKPRCVADVWYTQVLVTRYDWRPSRALAARKGILLALQELLLALKGLLLILKGLLLTFKGLLLTFQSILLALRGTLLTFKGKGCWVRGEG